MKIHQRENLQENLDIERLVENPVEYLKELDESGELQHVFPAFALTKGVWQSLDKHKEGDAFVHTLMTLGEVYKESPSDKEFGKIEDPHDLLIIILALLYHDTGKRDRNLYDCPEKRVYHPNESVKHVNKELAQYLSEEDLAIVAELVRKHDLITEILHISKRANKLFKLFSISGNLGNSQLLLKLSECDLRGREVSEEYAYFLPRNELLFERNVELLKLLQAQEKQGQTFPLNSISRETRDRINELVDSLRK
ncbi:hypothetical protein ACFL21_00340 [Patescibacteria group bacterium]